MSEFEMRMMVMMERRKEDRFISISLGGERGVQKRSVTL